MKPISTFRHYMASFFLIFLFATVAKSQPGGFEQFMGINLRVDEASLGKAQCVSHAREYHDWIRDQGKWEQDNSSKAIADYLIPSDHPLTVNIGGEDHEIYDLYDLSDENLTTVVGTLDRTSGEYTIGSDTWYSYWSNEYDEVWEVIPPNTDPELIRKHLRIFYYLGENCFLTGDEDNNGDEDCEDDVCTCDGGSPSFPNQQFKWNPPYQSQAEVHYDFFYDQVNGLGLSMSSAMNGTLPRYALGEYDPTSGQITFLERIPIQWSGSNFNPMEGEPSTAAYSYRERADWIFQFLLRYGSGGPSSAMTKFHPDETTDIQRGNVSYIESWNEPNKDWHTNDLQATMFTPAQYAAMASCDYDGHGNTVNINDAGVTHNYGLGAHQFNVPFVMGAPFNLDWGWVEGMNDWFVDFRPNSDFIFDILNFHHYSAIDITGGEWMCPEEDFMKTKLKGIVADRDAATWAAGRPLWLSEFGYSTGTGGGAQFPEIGLDDNELQAQWIARSFLEIASSGFDRAYVYELSDATALNTGAWDQQTGLLTSDGQAKRSWYYVYSLKNILGDREYESELLQPGCTGEEFDETGTGACPRIYKFSKGDDCQAIYAIWNPSSKGSDYVEYDYFLPLTCGNVATGIKLVNGSISGQETSLDIVNGMAKVNVTETPIFVIERPSQAPVVNCNTFLTPETVTCNSVTLAIDDQGQGFSSYQIWYIKADDVLPFGVNVNSPDFSPFTLDQSASPPRPIWQQYQHDVPANSPNIIVTGLEPDTEYLIYVVPQSENGIPEDYCHVSVETESTGESCALPITIISDSNVAPIGVGNDEGELFDNQGNACGLLNLEADFPFVDLQSAGRNMVVDLGMNYIIDDIQLFDGTDASIFTIDGSLDNTAGSYEILRQYFTNSLEEWVNISNFNQSIDGHRFIRFTNPDNLARIKEAVLCGREACLLNDNAATLSYCIDYDPGLVGWAMGCKKLTFRVKNTIDGGTPFDKIQLWYSTVGAFDPGEHPKVTRPNAQSVIKTFYNLPFSSIKLVDVGGLEANTEYWFAYRMLDDEGRSSRLYLMGKSYFTARCKEVMLEDFGPVIDDDCKLAGLFWETDGTLASGNFKVTEHNSQTSTPDAGALKTASIPATDSTSVYYYFIDQDDPASDSTDWLYWRWVDQGQDSTDWEESKVDSTGLCGDSLSVRSGAGGTAQELGGGILVYPNPATEELFLEVPEGRFAACSIFAASGQKMASHILPPEMKKHRLDISALPAGLYFLNLSAGHSPGHETLRFVVAK